MLRNSSSTSHETEGKRVAAPASWIAFLSAEFGGKPLASDRNILPVVRISLSSASATETGLRAAGMMFNVV